MLKYAVKQVTSFVSAGVGFGLMHQEVELKSYELFTGSNGIVTCANAIPPAEVRDK